MTDLVVAFTEQLQGTSEMVLDLALILEIRVACGQVSLTTRLCRPVSQAPGGIERSAPDCRHVLPVLKGQGGLANPRPYPFWVGGLLYLDYTMSLGAVVTAAHCLRQLSSPIDTILIWVETLQSSLASSRALR